MNTQTALKRCFDYFLDETHKPGFRDGNCVYYANGSEPVMCAVGCLIPERLQEEAGKVRGSVSELFHEIPELSVIFAEVDRDTLDDMQVYHDIWANPFHERSSREDFLNELQTLICFYEN